MKSINQISITKSEKFNSNSMYTGDHEYIVSEETFETIVNLLLAFEIHEIDPEDIDNYVKNFK